MNKVKRIVPEDYYSQSSRHSVVEEYEAINEEKEIRRKFGDALFNIIALSGFLSFIVLLFMSKTLSAFVVLCINLAVAQIIRWVVSKVTTSD